MILKVILDEHTFPVQVQEEMLMEAEDVFHNMDKDMDKGWQMSRMWVDKPTTVQRCQIAADKMLTAIENDNKKMTLMMAAYIMRRMPGIDAIDIDTGGDMTATQLIMGNRSPDQS